MLSWSVVRTKKHPANSVIDFKSKYINVYQYSSTAVTICYAIKMSVHFGIARLFTQLRNTPHSIMCMREADIYMCQDVWCLAYNARKREQTAKYYQWKENVRKKRLERLHDNVTDTENFYFRLRVDYVARRKHESPPIHCCLRRDNNISLHIFDNHLSITRHS